MIAAPYHASAVSRLTTPSGYATLRFMSKTASKLVALFMLLWLPLSGGSALAASLAMQLQSGSCHESGAMAQHDMGEHQMLQHNNQAESANPSSACASCTVCHLACSGFSVAPSHSMQLAVATASTVTFMPEIFISHVSAPLLPPPLARA